VQDASHSAGRSGSLRWMSASATRIRSRRQKSGSGPRWCGNLMRTAACLALSSLVACASMGQKSTQPNLTPWPEIRFDIRVETLGKRMFEYSITFAAEIELGATAIERRASDATVRRNALLWRVRATPEMRKGVLSAGAGIDAWILARQMDQLFREGAGAGPSALSNPKPSRSPVDWSTRCGRSAVRSPSLLRQGPSSSAESSIRGSPTILSVT
jgi:hypothetical protein